MVTSAFMFCVIKNLSISQGYSSQSPAVGLKQGVCSSHKKKSLPTTKGRKKAAGSAAGRAAGNARGGDPGSWPWHGFLSTPPALRCWQYPSGLCIFFPQDPPGRQTSHSHETCTSQRLPSVSSRELRVCKFPLQFHQAAPTAQSFPWEASRQPVGLKLFQKVPCFLSLQPFCSTRSLGRGLRE